MQSLSELDQAKPLQTVKVPEQFAPLFAKAQEYVSSYFGQKVADPTKGTIELFDQRYIMVRAASMSVDFFDAVRGLYHDYSDREASEMARSLLYDLAYAIGKMDARNFHQQMGVTDPIEKLSAGPIHFAYAGWAFVDIFAESTPSPDENYYLVYDHPFSFESDAWLKAGKEANFPVCVMNAGYSSGWCEESFGLELAAVEITCKAKGDEACRFIMAPSAKLEGHVTNYAAAHPELASRIRNYQIPGFFERQQAVKKLEDSRRALAGRVDEIDKQRKAILNMYQDVESARKELAQANEKLELEAARRKQAQQRLKAVNAELDAFVRTASHDLRSPLVSLHGFLTLLKETETENISESGRHFLERIEANAKRMEQLLEDLLQLSRAGREMAPREKIDLNGLLEFIRSDFAPLVERKGATLVIPQDLPIVTGERSAISQIFTNLISNALKYMGDEPQPRVELAWSREGDHYHFAITDNGIGVDPAHHQRIFDSFQSLKDERAGEVDSSGVGLNIVKRIVERYEGKVWVESDGRKGSVFHFTIKNASKSQKEEKQDE